MRIIKPRQFELCVWQAESFRSVKSAIAAGKKDFLCVATPGAGKTKFALRTAHELFLTNKINRLVIVTPTEYLKNQWAKEAAQFTGIDLDPDFANCQHIETPDFHGISITYALLGMDKHQIHKKGCEQNKTMVIFDEVHHAGDNLTWGNAIKTSFEFAAFRLAISGTAFRSDDNPIPFITYKNAMSVSDYTYSYERAIKENVCRPVYFTSFEGKMKWKVGGDEFEHSFKESLTPDQVSKRLKTALDPRGEYVKAVLEAANTKLKEIRKHHPDAAALVFATDQKHAREVAKVLYSVTGKMPPVIVSSEGSGRERIQVFSQSTEPWLVSVRMVSEGVDIPRLRVGVYLTITKAELFFRQAVGRFVRILKGLRSQDAFIFIPQEKDIIKLAETIQEERDHALEDCKSGDIGMQEDLFGDSYTPALKGKFIPLQAQALGQKTMTVNVDISSGMRTEIIRSDDPAYLIKQRLKDRLNKLAKVIAVKNNNQKPDWKLAHKEWIQNGGKEMEAETIDELQKRVNFYMELARK